MRLLIPEPPADSGSAGFRRDSDGGGVFRCLELEGLQAVTLEVDLECCAGDPSGGDEMIPPPAGMLRINVWCSWKLPLRSASEPRIRTGTVVGPSGVEYSVFRPRNVTTDTTTSDDVIIEDSSEGGWRVLAWRLAWRVLVIAIR